jgi:predicted flavoprotein YhiN
MWKNFRVCLLLMFFTSGAIGEMCKARGSDGGWVECVTNAGIKVTPLAPSNCGFIAAWSDVFRGRFEGQPLKRVALSFGGRTVRGEAIITRNGLEGGGIYALSAPLREATTAGVHRSRTSAAPIPG